MASLKIIFAGTPEFAVPCLKSLINSEHSILAVYTQPDRPKGRGQKLTYSPVKELALQHQLHVEQPLTLRDPAAQKRLIDFQADVMVVVAYGLILPQIVLDAPKYGCVNIHASLLPRWRGAAPIQHAILAGDAETGVSIMRMEAGLDTGPVMRSAKIPITPADTAKTLHDSLAELGALELLKTLGQMTQGFLPVEPQDNSKATYAAKIDKEDAHIDWQQSAIVIDRQVRAYNPWPIAFTELNQQRIRIWQTEVIKQSITKSPGTIIEANNTGIDVVTSDGVLRIKQLQLPGAKVLPVAEVLKAKADLFKPGEHFKV